MGWGRWRRLVLPLTLAGTSLVAGGVALASLPPATMPTAHRSSGAATPTDEGPPGPARVVPLLSARRTPDLVRQTIARSRLGAGIDAALAGAPSSCAAVDLGGISLHRVRADVPLLPASNLKLLTATAVLDWIKPADRLTTEVATDAPLGAAGVVDGPLYLVGGGDPLLQTADYAAFGRRSAPERREQSVYTKLESLADAVRAAGVTSVTGGVVADESRYDGQRALPTWRASYAADGEIGPESALDLNGGFVAYTPKAVPAPSPAKHAADTFDAMLRARGVQVAGDTRVGVTPGNARVIATQPSPPVRDLVAEMLKESDNLTAELLVKELGVRVARRGTTEAGLDVVRQALAAAGLPTERLVVNDGSGLDRGDRASCSLLLAALDRAGPSGDLAAGLPVAGREGTLARRFVGTPLVGRLRAKTGTLDGVTGLSGFLDQPAGPPLSFSFLANDLPLPDAAGRVRQDAVAGALGRWPDAPPLDEVSP